MSQNRYYSKKDYKGDYSAFGTAAVFIAVGILSLVFRRYARYETWSNLPEAG